MSHSSESDDWEEMLALQALAYIASDERLAATFCIESGILPEQIAERAKNSEFLGFVLDYLLTNETALTDFCTEHGYDAAMPGRARQALPGGVCPNWT